jgi:pimeloyl-ACP methyl ester carboxylesterase
VDLHKFGLVGHSQGAIIAPMLAARNHDIAFVVMMAGSAVPGDEELVEQVRMLTVAMGAPAEQTEKAVARQREVMELVKSSKDEADFVQKVQEKYAGDPTGATVVKQAHTLMSPWYRYFVQYDPADALRKVRCPVLAINGSKDVQVSAAQNLPLIRKLLETAGNKDVETVEFPGLNHLFQTAKTGTPSEYSQIDETIAPVVLEKIAAWILAHEF